MNRMTIEIGPLPGYMVDTDKIKQTIDGPAGYSGEAIEKLAKFENFYDDLIEKQNQISIELEMLRNEGKEKSVRFREIFGNKLMNNNTLILLKAYGLE